MSSENPQEPGNLERQSEELYRKYGKRFEPEHNGKYLVITPNGETVLGSSLLEVLGEATRRFGLGNFAYKVGERAVGKIRLKGA